MSYCSHHGIEYGDGDCPRCLQDERHREVLEQARSSHEELIEAARDAAEAASEAARESDFRRANPGDYQCPHCKYITLKLGATRCPACHGTPSPDYWPRAIAREQAKAEELKRLAGIRATEQVAAEKKRLERNAELERQQAAARVEIERQRTAAKQAAAKEQATRERRAASAKRWKFFWLIYFIYLLPALALISSWVVLVFTGRVDFGPNRTAMAYLMGDFFLDSTIFSALIVPLSNWRPIVKLLYAPEGTWVERAIIIGCFLACAIGGLLAHRHTTRPV